MNIIIIGGPKEGKTTVATKIKEVLESLGATVAVKDEGDFPKTIFPETKPLKFKSIFITVVNI